MKGIPKDFKRAVQPLLDQGWKPIGTGRHWRFIPPADSGFRSIFCPKTPSEYRGLKNFQCEVKRILRGEQR